MRLRPPPTAKPKPDYVRFAGGLDTESSAMELAAGSVQSSLNYEMAVGGGYARIKGYELFDGQTRPSDVDAVDVAATFITTLNAGDLVADGTGSNARRFIFVKSIDGGCMAAVPPGDEANIQLMAGKTLYRYNTATVVGTMSSTPLMASNAGYGDPKVQAERRVEAAAGARARIGLPGGGPAAQVVQVFMLNGVTYCMVYHDKKNIYRSSASGWLAIPLGEEIRFTNANASVTGNTLTQGGVTATIARVVVETGTLQSGTNTGRLILRNRVGGNFAAGAATTTGGGALSLAGAQSEIQLVNIPAVDRGNIIVHNFGGQLTSLRAYGTDSGGRAWEFDGTVLVPINTGAAVDTPSHVYALKGYLYLSIGSSMIRSSVGAPLRFVASEGAAEIAVGNTVVGFCGLPGDSLGIITRKSSHVLVGSDTASMRLDPIRSDVGALPNSIVEMSDVYMMDDRGILNLATSDKFGNFVDATLSRRIQRVVDRIRPAPSCACVSRTRGLYMLFVGDGTVLTMGVKEGRVTGFMPLDLGMNVTCVVSSEDASGVERIFVGTNQGVFELNRGSTFDGEEIESHLKLWHMNQRAALTRKTYKGMFVEMRVDDYSELEVHGDLDYGDGEAEDLEAEELTQAGTGGVWGASYWGDIYWGAASVGMPWVKLKGGGVNMSITFRSNTKLDLGHTLQGAFINHIPRRMARR